jgi:hypothetical protein
MGLVNFPELMANPEGAAEEIDHFVRFVVSI